MNVKTIKTQITGFCYIGGILCVIKHSEKGQMSNTSRLLTSENKRFNLMLK